MACAEPEEAGTAFNRRAGQAAPEDAQQGLLHHSSAPRTALTGEATCSLGATRGELEACDSSLGSWGDPLPPSQPVADQQDYLTFDD